MSASTDRDEAERGFRVGIDVLCEHGLEAAVEQRNGDARVELYQQAEAFRKNGLAVASLTYDSVAVLRNFAQRQGIHGHERTGDHVVWQFSLEVSA